RYGRIKCQGNLTLVSEKFELGLTMLVHETLLLLAQDFPRRTLVISLRHTLARKFVRNSNADPLTDTAHIRLKVFKTNVIVNDGAAVDGVVGEARILSRLHDLVQELVEVPVFAPRPAVLEVRVRYRLLIRMTFAREF